MTVPGGCSYATEIPAQPNQTESGAERRADLSPEKQSTYRTWECPHEPLEQSEYCPFHTPPDRLPAELDKSELFIAAVNESGASSDATRARRKKQFIGATFAQLDIQGQRLDAGDGYPIRLDNAVVADGIQADGAVINHSLYLPSARVAVDETSDEDTEAIAFRGARFGEDVELCLANADITGGAGLSFAATRFPGGGDISFRRASFRGSSRISFSEAKIGGESAVSFESALFDGPVEFSFDHAVFQGGAGVSWSGVVFADRSRLSFLEARFERGELSVHSAEFHGDSEIRLTGATFGDESVLSFGETDTETGSLRVEMVDLNLPETEFTGTELTDSIFSRSAFTDVDLTDADLSKANLSETDLSDQTLKGTDLSGARLRDADLSGATLRGCTLSDADAAYADFSEADCRDADFSDADLEHARLDGADLRATKLDGTGLYETTCVDVHLNTATSFGSHTIYDKAVDASTDDDPVSKAAWTHWKIHSLQMDHGLYRQATTQKHHVEEARLRAVRSKRALSDDISVSDVHRYLRHTATYRVLYHGERPIQSTLGVVGGVLALTVLYPLFGLAHTGVVYQYQLAVPTIDAILVPTLFSVEQFLAGVAIPVAAVLGGVVPVQSLLDISTGATALGPGRIVQEVQRGAGLLSALTALILGVQRLLLYLRQRTGTDQYGGVLSWLTGE